MSTQRCSCGRPVQAGRSGSQTSHDRTCLICMTNALLKDWRYPASAEGQRAWREKKATS